MCKKAGAWKLIPTGGTYAGPCQFALNSAWKSRLSWCRVRPVHPTCSH